MVCASKTENAMVLIEGFGGRGEDIIHRANLGADIAVDTRIFYIELFVIRHEVRAPKVSHF